MPTTDSSDYILAVSVEPSCPKCVPLNEGNLFMAKIDPIPADREGLIPHLVCDPCTEAIEFYKKAFDAEEVGRVGAPGSDKVMHAAMLIAGKPIFLADDFPEYCEGKSSSPKTLGGTPVTIHRYVEDCDAAVKQAVDAGATVTMPPGDMFWGDRYAVVVDPFGHTWSFATRIAEPTPDEVKQAMDQMFAGQ